jgi:hypothetical protein
LEQLKALHGHAINIANLQAKRNSKKHSHYSFSKYKNGNTGASLNIKTMTLGKSKTKQKINTAKNAVSVFKMLRRMRHLS